jgi:hypothetical protein
LVFSGTNSNRARPFACFVGYRGITTTSIFNFNYIFESPDLPNLRQKKPGSYLPGKVATFCFQGFQRRLLR